MQPLHRQTKEVGTGWGKVVVVVVVLMVVVEEEEEEEEASD